MTQKDYQALLAQSKNIKILEAISHLLEWDHETFMPEDAADARSEQVELMAALIHQRKTSADFKKALEKLIDLKTGEVKEKGLAKEQKAALREWRRDFRMDTALPNDFVKEFAKLTSEAITVWTKARKENDFALFAPYLEKIVDMSRQKADYLGYEEHPYDALLDCFEPEMTVRQLDHLFPKVRKGIHDLLDKIQSRPQVDDHFLHGKFSKEKQLEFGRFLLKEIGYDLNKGRLDITTHPFSMSLHPSDSRVTTRIHTTSIFDSLSATLHEGGHSLYEMGMNPELYGSPLCEAISLSIHESQSRLWETRIGQSKAFWKHYLPYLKKEFPKLKEITLADFYKGVNRVAPSFIRVEADEVTYSLHVILRYELEKELIKGSLNVREIPEVWNNLMKTILGITPPTDREGCLQDIHWSMGAFGYFPTYALGNLYASQFFSAFEKAYPDWEKRVVKGELLFLREWLRNEIHQHGKTYRAAELVKKVSGQKLSETPHLSYLGEKYREIYRFK